MTGKRVATVSPSPHHSKRTKQTSRSASEPPAGQKSAESKPAVPPAPPATPSNHQHSAPTMNSPADQSAAEPAALNPLVSTGATTAPTAQDTTATSAAATANQNCGHDNEYIFFTIPIEVRNQIYDLYHADRVDEIGMFKDGGMGYPTWILHPPLRRVCGAIRQEMATLFDKPGARRFHTTLNLAMTGRKLNEEPPVIQAFQQALVKFPQASTDGSTLTLTITRFAHSKLASLAIIARLVHTFGFPRVGGQHTLLFDVEHLPNADHVSVTAALEDLREVSRGWRIDDLTNTEIELRTFDWIKRRVLSQPQTIQEGKDKIVGTWGLDASSVGTVTFQALRKRQNAGMKF